MVHMKVWANDCQRSLAKITTLPNALFNPKVCPLRQPTMLPTNVATLADKMERFKVSLWGVAPKFSGRGPLLLVQFGLLASEVAFDERDITHNDMMMWMHLRGPGVSLFTLCPGDYLNQA